MPKPTPKKPFFRPTDGFYQTLYVVLLISASIIVYHYSNIKRVEGGYFTDSVWITINTVAYIFFFAILTGYAVSKLVKKA